SAMGRAMACAARTLNPGEGDPLGASPGGCDPTVCDPVDPTGPAPSTAACLKALAPDTTAGPGLNRLCWAVDCARQSTSTASACWGGGGGPGSGAPASGGAEVGLSICATMMCAEGSPTPGPFGACQCSQPGGSGGTTPGGFTPRPPT